MSIGKKRLLFLIILFVVWCAYILGLEMLGWFRASENNAEREEREEIEWNYADF